MPKAFTYEFVEGDDMASLDNFATLREAADERFDAGVKDPDFTRYMPSAGDFLLRVAVPSYLPAEPPPVAPSPTVPHYGDENFGGWGTMQRHMIDVATLYVRAVDAEGNEVQDVASYAYWKTTAGGGGGIAYRPEVPDEPPFDPYPPPNGVERRYPREIFGLGDPGQPGQVARFVARVNPDTGAQPTAADKQNSGKLFKYQAKQPAQGGNPEVPAGWYEVTDGSYWTPDTLTVFEDFASIQPGDYCNLYNVTQTIKVMKRLRWTPGFVDWTAPRDEVIEYFSAAEAGSNLFYSEGTPQYTTLWATLLDHVGSRWGQDNLNFDPDDQEWSGSVVLGTGAGGEQVIEVFSSGKLSGNSGKFSTFPRAPGASTSVSDYVAGIGGLFALGRVLSSNHAYPHIIFGLKDRTKKVEWVVAAAIFEGPLSEFNTFGQSFLNRQTSVWATTDQGGIDAIGPRVGDASARPALDAPGELSAGFQAYCIGIVKWNMGAFKYPEST